MLSRRKGGTVSKKWIDQVNVEFFKPEDKGVIGAALRKSVIAEDELDTLMSGATGTGGTLRSYKGRAEARERVKADLLDEADYNYSTPKGSTVSAGKSTYKSCHESHPPLPIVDETGSYEVFGGSCIRPVINDMDLFIGFDHGMARTSRQFPWNHGEEFQFKIVDMQPPDNVQEFTKMLDYTIEAIRAGKKVFMGCIGGHGRTGTVFAALVTRMTGNADSIKYVRDNYCKKAVESTAQIEWLHKHFGVTKDTPSKGGAVHSTISSQTSWDWNSDKKYTGKGLSKKAAAAVIHRYQPVNVKGHIHGDNDKTY
jgi:protein-tyrosine phosphatase